MIGGGELVLWGRDVRDGAHFVKIDETWPAAQTGIAGPTFEARLPELST